MTQQNACLKAFLSLLLRYQDSELSLPFFKNIFHFFPSSSFLSAAAFIIFCQLDLTDGQFFLAMWWWWPSCRSDAIPMFFWQMLPSLLMWLFELFGMYDFCLGEWWFFQFDYEIFLLTGRLPTTRASAALPPSPCQIISGKEVHSLPLNVPLA